MSSIVSGNWTAPVNTKISADTHICTNHLTYTTGANQVFNLYTVPASVSRFIVTKIVLRNATPAASLSTTPSTASLGSSGTAPASLLAAQSLTNLTQVSGAGSVVVIPVGVSASATVPVASTGLNPADVVQLKIVTAPTAAGTVVVDLFGYFEQG